MELQWKKRLSRSKIREGIQTGMISIEVLIQFLMKTIGVLAFAIMEADPSLSVCVLGLCTISPSFQL